MLLSYTNSKLKKDGIASFSIPAIKTCPNANTCKIGCYATQGFFNMPSVKKKYAANFNATKSPLFTSLMIKECQKAKIVRIHASGDFYNKDYFEKWIQIADQCPNTKFYAYTKMISLVKYYLATCGIPKNLTIIFSEGGKQDNLINPNMDRHARVFSSLKDLKAAGYANVTEHDTGAMGNNHKIGLVYHGAKSKAWKTVQ